MNCVRMKNQVRLQVLLFALLVTHSGFVWAHTGIPLLSYYAIYSILLVIPIIAAESFVLMSRVSVSVLGAIGTMTIANIASTAAGILIVIGTILDPIALYLIDFDFPEGTIADLATLALLIPFYFLSVWIETRVVGWRIPSADQVVLKNTIQLANKASYFMFAIFLISRIVKGRIVNGFFLP